MPMPIATPDFDPMHLKARRLKALQRQIQRLQQQLVRLHGISNRYSWLRVITFVGGIALSGGVLFLSNLWLFWGILVLSIVLFGLVVYRHRQLERMITRFTIWQQIKQTQLARAQLEWAQIPPALPITPDPNHPFAVDLDLAGSYSLHQLLDRAVSVAGSQRLYQWLTAPTPPLSALLQRQGIVREMIPLALFRDKLTLNAQFSTRQVGRWDTQPLVAWFQAEQNQSSLGRWLLLFIVLAILNIGLWGMNQLGWIGPLWLFTFIPYMGLQLLKVRETSEVFQTATAVQEAVEQLVAILHQLEIFSYRQTPELRARCAPIWEQGQRPSTYLRRIRWLVTAIGLQGNPILALLLNLVIPWNFTFAYLLHNYKTRAAKHVPAWLDAWFEVEALSSLANLAYLNPTYTFPLLRAQDALSGNAIFRVQGLGHPLLPDAQKVCNDFAIKRLGEVAIITGSNMAGKSTFLRALGMNLALAYAGGVVDARSLDSELFRLFTCIKINDSVTKGVSYFYAEVQRLKALLDALEEIDALPLFFCIDEIFRGTNNRERLSGSRAYIRALVNKHGTGLISTHDLELVKLADEMLAITNYHFRDDLVDGTMTFDYRLHPGPCPTTNALKVMRNAGLPVPIEEIQS
ncbi:MAG: hypothetical protein NT075_13035 [Chloroflexi bacterium]|nr:hypothetical protein [Chloroflexota bacterium]